MQIINTSDGSHTIFLPGINEQYHSVKGAITESKYVYIEKGFYFHKVINPRVFEVGFGTGLNCFLTALAAEKEKRPTLYFSIEKFPLDKIITSKLNFVQLVSNTKQELFDKIHDCTWNEIVQISGLKNMKNST